MDFQLLACGVVEPLGIEDLQGDANFQFVGHWAVWIMKSRQEDKLRRPSEPTLPDSGSEQLQYTSDAFEAGFEPKEAAARRAAAERDRKQRGI